MPRLSLAVLAVLLATSAAKPCRRVSSSEVSLGIVPGTSVAYGSEYAVSSVSESTSSTSFHVAATTTDSSSSSTSVELISSYSTQATSSSSFFPTSTAYPEPITTSSSYPGDSATESVTSTASSSAETSSAEATTTEATTTEATTTEATTTEATTTEATTTEATTTEATTTEATTTDDVTITTSETVNTETSTTITSSPESSPTSTNDQCLEALTSQGQDAIADCSARLIVTVTPPASTITLTETSTAVESTVDHYFTTETTTTTATETLLFTTSTTVTASTETDTITEQTTQSITTTSIYTAPTTVTTTVFNYQGGAKVRDVTARQTAPPTLPDYASAACDSFDAYVSACQVVGVETVTVTLPAATETSTETVFTSATTTFSTVSSTQTDVVFETATVSTTETSVESLTVTTTTTETAIVTSTVATEVQTTTPTSTVAYACQATGVSFRDSSLFPDGTTRFMNAVNSALVAWQTFATSPTASALASSTWVFGAGGYLGLSSGSLVAYVNAGSSASTLQVSLKTPAAVAAGVAAGTYVQVQGCVDRTTNRLTMLADGRSNILSCGNALYLSKGTGTDVRSDCVQLTPTAVSA